MSQAVLSAGLPIWPKIFHNLRASRQTELEERIPRKTVCEWMGNSETVANHYYLQVLEDHIDSVVVQENSGQIDYVRAPPAGGFRTICSTL